ncbi:MAG TPA: Do family serine endopeptidase [Polyangiaceae bacterium]|nr:Do family serine endopeptidase [Polyangiaceae bacterium]
MSFFRTPLLPTSTGRFPRYPFYLMELLSACDSSATHASREAPAPAENARARDSAFVSAVATLEPPTNRGTFLADVAERTKGAVVSVASTRIANVESPEQRLDDPLLRRFFAPGLPDGDRPSALGPGRQLDQREEHGLGSGVLVGQGLILTNAHVVAGASELQVTSEGGRAIAAKLLGSDPKSDLAVLRVTGDASNLPHLEFASSSRLRLGELVLAIGNPFGVGETVTLGIVSAKGRSDLGINDYEDFIQTDAAINPGNSGGALVNLDGQLVGIPSAILSRSGGYMGVGFAIPSDMARPIMNSLVEHGHVSRGYMGVAIQNLDEELAKALHVPDARGVVIADVTPRGPAARAGIERGDIVTAIDGEPTASTGQLRNRIAATGGGKTVHVDLIRQGEKKSVDVKLDDLPETSTPGGSSAGPSDAPSTFGLVLAPLNEVLRRRLHVPSEIKQGAVVISVAPQSPAAHADIRPDDVILEVDRKSVTGPQALAALSGKSDPVPLLVWRENRTFFSVIKP